MFTFTLCVTYLIAIGRGSRVIVNDLTICVVCVPMVFDLILANIIFG